jgi:tryptophan synthase alpha chain
VDLPPEEADELLAPSQAAGLDVIFLTAPTTDAMRLPVVLRHATGFVYHVSITGITGTASASTLDVEAAVTQIREATDLPVAIGFGIKTAAQAETMARIGDAAVVGSALVNEIAAHLGSDGRPQPDLVEHVVGFVADLAAGVRRRGLGGDALP